MPRKWVIVLSGLLALTMLAVLFVSIGTARLGSILERTAQPGSGDGPPPERERETAEDAPAISFIDSPSPVCERPRPASNDCYIRWGYMQVSASSSQYIISMTVEIDGDMRANYSGFFQTSMYVPTEMSPKGFKVACGTPDDSIIPGLGRSHSYIIRSRETGGLKAANYGSVTCPAGPYAIFVPVASK